MTTQAANTDQNGGVSKVKLALGAASLFLFLVGVKRTFQSTPEGTEISDRPARKEREESSPGEMAEQG